VQGQLARDAITVTPETTACIPTKLARACAMTIVVCAVTAPAIGFAAGARGATRTGPTLTQAFPLTSSATAPAPATPKATRRSTPTATAPARPSRTPAPASSAPNSREVSSRHASTTDHGMFLTWLLVSIAASGLIGVGVVLIFRGAITRPLARKRETPSRRREIAGLHTAPHSNSPYGEPRESRSSVMLDRPHDKPWVEGTTPSFETSLGDAGEALRLADEQRDLAGAEAAYRRGQASGAHRLGPGDGAAALTLGKLLEQQGDLEGAEAAFRRADECGEAEGGIRVGALLERRGDVEGAEAAYRRADERGDATGAFNLGALLARRNDLDGAEAAYRRAEGRGDPYASANLGVLLEQRGDFDSAEAAYRRADESGAAPGSFNLGCLLEQRGDLAAAEGAYRRAAQHGQPDLVEMARAALRELRVPAGARSGGTPGIGKQEG
jgi:Flp pilus assembly protein TadD